MSKVGIIYWSSTGNTEAMAQAVEEGAKAAGADVEIMEVADADVDKALSFDVLALGCPAMGDEELEDGEFEPFFSDLEGKLSGKKVALFGSYDWGDGEWMRTWCDRAKDAGAELVEDEGLICNNTPDDEGLFVWAAFFFDNKVRTPCQLVFQDGEYEAAAREVGLGCEVEWFPGGWMSRQRFAGRLGGKAEFPCGLTGGGGGRGASLSA